MENKFTFIKKYLNISDMAGKIIKSIEVNKEEAYILFKLDNGENFLMYHEQDCCECVYIEDICGDLDNLIGSELIISEEVEGEIPADNNIDKYTESYTYTFYKLATIKGYVTIRWFGESNGYYSESVDISKVEVIK